MYDVSQEILDWENSSLMKLVRAPGCWTSAPILWELPCALPDTFVKFVHAVPAAGIPLEAPLLQILPRPGASNELPPQACCPETSIAQGRVRARRRLAG